MKTATITLILFLFCAKVYSQTDTTARQSDAAWVRQLIANENKEQATTAKKDSLSQYVEWTDGKVVYGPDSCLRIAQLSGRFSYSEKDYYTTFIQYLSNHKAVELKVPADTVNYSFNDYPISHIYRLPGPKGTYLIIASKTDTVQKATLYKDDGSPTARPAGQDSIYERIGIVASLVHVMRDSLLETGFETGADNDKSPYSEIISGGALSADLDTYLPGTKDIPKPFLNFDPVKNELSFLALYNSVEDEGDNDGRGSSMPFLKIYSGVFKYKDSVFTLLSDTGYYYPSLESLDEIIAAKKFKTGNSITNVVATAKYEEVGGGVMEILYVDYYVRGQSIYSVDYRFEKTPAAQDLHPDYKVQKDGALVLITDLTTPNRDGRCGECDYIDSEFWLINQKRKGKLFTFSSNSDTGYTTYTYNDGKSDVNGRFYLKKIDAGDDEKWGENVDNTYWKNNSTYVFHVSDGILARNFYLHFLTVNSKTVVKLTAGKLQNIMHKKAVK